MLASRDQCTTLPPECFQARMSTQVHLRAGKTLEDVAECLRVVPAIAACGGLGPAGSEASISDETRPATADDTP